MLGAVTDPDRLSRFLTESAELLNDERAIVRMEEVHAVPATPVVILVAEDWRAGKQHRAFAIEQDNPIGAVFDECAKVLIAFPQPFSRSLLFGDVLDQNHESTNVTVRCSIRHISHPDVTFSIGIFESPFVVDLFAGKGSLEKRPYFGQFRLADEVGDAHSIEIKLRTLKPL